MQGIVLIDKPPGKTSFYLVKKLRHLCQEKKIGHSGTLDPFATGVMVMLLGRPFTRLSNSFLSQDKEYIATAKLGEATDTYDCEGKCTFTSDIVPSINSIEQILQNFQGEVEQTPPMFSAKKINGKKLYELARQGQLVERPSVKVHIETTLISYHYPYLEFKVTCSKGTYIRSIAHDIGVLLGCGAHLTQLKRTRSGHFLLKNCLPLDMFEASEFVPQMIEESVFGLP